MRINLCIAATTVGAITYIARGGALQADAGESSAGRRRHNGIGLSRKTVRGTLLAVDDGVEFFHERWAYVDFHSFELSVKEPTLNSFQNRPWHELVRHQ